MGDVSAPVWMAQRRSFSSFSVSAGSDTGDTREVDALVARDRAGDNDLGVHVVSFDLGHLETDLAIVDDGSGPPDGNRPAGP